MVRYKGYTNPKWWKNDNLLTNISGVMAFGVALIPTNQINSTRRTLTLIPYDWPILDVIHYVFASVLFLSFSILSIFVFTIGQKAEAGTTKSIINENNIYRVCGYLIIVFVVMVPISHWMDLFDYSTLVFETLSLIAFGIVWLIKGRALGPILSEKLYREHSVKS